MKGITKERKFEIYVYLFFSIVVVVLGVLILNGYLKIEDENKLFSKYPTVFAWILIGFGSISIIYSIYAIVKQIRLKKSCFYVFKKEYDNALIKSKLGIVGASVISIDETKDNIEIEASFDNIDYFCDIYEAEIVLYIEAHEWYYDSLTEQEQDRIDDVIIRLNPLELSCEEVINKFINFIMSNKF